MKVTVKQVTSWERVANAARMTVHKDALGHEPSDKFKRTILMAEHSPIRNLEFDVTIEDVPYFVVMHLVRHNQGIEKFVGTSREDRTGVNREERKQTDLVSCMFSLNTQALINISRKRLCNCADRETIKVWKAVVEAIREIDPIVASFCAPECLYRGFCPEQNTCGYSLTQRFEKDLLAYRNLVKV